jgi:hypothetical protein
VLGGLICCALSLIAVFVFLRWRAERNLEFKIRSASAMPIVSAPDVISVHKWTSDMTLPRADTSRTPPPPTDPSSLRTAPPGFAPPPIAFDGGNSIMMTTPPPVNGATINTLPRVCVCDVGSFTHAHSQNNLMASRPLPPLVITSPYASSTHATTAVTGAYISAAPAGGVYGSAPAVPGNSTYLDLQTGECVRMCGLL